MDVHRRKTPVACYAALGPGSRGHDADVNMIYRISRRYRWYLRFWAFVGAAIAILAVTRVEAWSGDWRYRVVLACCFAVGSAYLLLQDYALGRTVETNDHAIQFRKTSGQIKSIPWDQVAGIVNHAAQGFLHVATVGGEKLIIDHHFDNVQGLVGEVVARTGFQVEEK